MPSSWAASRASRDLSRDGQRIGKWHRAARQDCRKVLAIDEFHDEGLAVGTRIAGGRHRLDTLHAVNRRNVRVVQGRQCAGFALEPCETLRVADEQVRHDLDRDVAPEPGVARAIHLTHAAGAQHRDDFIAPRRVPDGRDMARGIVGRFGRLCHAVDLKDYLHVTWSEVIRKLKAAWFVEVQSGKGSHVLLKHPTTGKEVWVAVHTTKDAGRLGNRILREAGSNDICSTRLSLKLKRTAPATKRTARTNASR